MCNACVHVVEKKKKFRGVQVYVTSKCYYCGSAHTCFIDTCAVYHSTAVNGGAQIYFVMHIR